MQVMQSHVNEATARVLCKSGCDVAAPKTQNCCGALHAHIGDIEKAKELAQRNIAAFEDWEKENGALDAIVINAAGCGAVLKEYPGWFKGDDEWEGRSKNFSEKVRDVSEFLDQDAFKTRLQGLLGSGKSDLQTGTQELGMQAREARPNTVGGSTLEALGETVPGDVENRLDAATAQNPAPLSKTENQNSKLKTRLVTYHDACHLAHGQGIRAEPRDLLQMLADSGEFEVVNLTEAEMCCGSAGSYNIMQPEMAMQLLERKMKHIAATGAGVVVTGNPGCAMQIMLGAQKFGPPVKVLHPVQVLDHATK
jgi:Fe-S oxidoreductase